MAETIYKYTLEVTDHFTLDLPFEAKVLTVQVQRGVPCIWAQVDPTNMEFTSRRSFRVVGTGHPINEDGLRYIGTFQLDGGALVFHLYEKPTT